MKKSKSSVLFICCISLLLLASCIREEWFANDPEGNFEQLWKIIDEQYCFLDYKQIDWDELHEKYSQRITPDMDDDELFEVLSNMLYELKDGHVNLISEKSTFCYTGWYQSYKVNFNPDLINRFYLESSGNYREAGGIKYKILEGNIGYMYYESFQSLINDSDLDQIFTHLSACKGLIIDVRNNTGGTITNSSLLASRFTNQEVLTGYICHKTGKGHNDFSDPKAIYLKPSHRSRWQKKVVVLTNRSCFSASNDFVNSMRCLPNVTTIGDTTGGGSGLPFTSELPNGWTVRFSSSPHFDKDMNHIEFGIDPDIPVNLLVSDERDCKDTLIEKARKLLNQ